MKVAMAPAHEAGSGSFGEPWTEFPHGGLGAILPCPHFGDRQSGGHRGPCVSLESAAALRPGCPTRSPAATVRDRLRRNRPMHLAGERKARRAMP